MTHGVLIPRPDRNFGRNGIPEFPNLHNLRILGCGNLRIGRFGQDSGIPQIAYPRVAHVWDSKKSENPAILGAGSTKFPGFRNVGVLAFRNSRNQHFGESKTRVHQARGVTVARGRNTGFSSESGNFRFPWIAVPRKNEMRHSGTRSSEFFPGLGFIAFWACERNAVSKICRAVLQVFSQAT